VNMKSTPESRIRAKLPRGVKFNVLLTKGMPNLPFSYYHNEHYLVELKTPITMWKKVLCGYDSISPHKVIKLLIPAGALVVVHSTVAKCRTNFAITAGDCFDTFSSFDRNFDYPVDGYVKFKGRTRDFLNVSDDCGPGIHCFPTFRQAEKYYFL
jgi:hypothetical protein